MTDTPDPDPGKFEQTLTDLTAFQRHILLCLGDDGPTYGLSLKRRLEAFGYAHVPHGRVYPNLDTLKEQGFVSKTKQDDRTNEYRLTRRGVVAVETIADQWTQAAATAEVHLEPDTHD